MSTCYFNVELRLFDESSFTCRTIGTALSLHVDSFKLSFYRKQLERLKEITLSPLVNTYRFSHKTVSVSIRKSTGDGCPISYLVTFDSPKDTQDFLSSIQLLEAGCAPKIAEVGLSTFDKRTDSWSAVQYFQFYSYLSQQQNMMQDYIRTSTYQRAILANSSFDFRGKVVLDVGAGSGILSFFAIQAGATRVYAVEASNMASHCNSLVQANKLAGRIVVISGKIEEVSLPEPVDVIISEPMGYMLYNERMLESYVHARKFLAKHLRQPIRNGLKSRSIDICKSKKDATISENDGSGDDVQVCSDSEKCDEVLPESGNVDDEENDGQDLTDFSTRALPLPGIMFPSVANLYIIPFCDEALFAEQYAKANFWYQQSFHGMDLTALRNAAISEYFNQPIVDTFDVGICPALPCIHKVDFRTVTESELASVDIPLHYQITTCTTIHGLAFWFDVGFLGSERDVWLSTSPTEPLTHWYQVRCLLGTPLFVQEGQTLNGRLTMRANSRQSYDVQIELIVPGSQTRITNTLDLKNPHFRYNGFPTAPPPGSHNRSPTETYYANLCAQQQQLDLQSQSLVNSANGGVMAAGTPSAGFRSNNSLYTINHSNQSVVGLSSIGATPSTLNLAHPIGQLATAGDNSVRQCQNQSSIQSMQLSPQPATVSNYVPLVFEQQSQPGINLDSHLIRGPGSNNSINQQASGSIFDMLSNQCVVTNEALLNFNANVPVVTNFVGPYFSTSFSGQRSHSTNNNDTALWRPGV